MNNKCCLTNITLHGSQKPEKNSVVMVSSGKIDYIGPAPEQQGQNNVHVIDCSGLHLLPGFIDLQINGGFGYDFTADPDSIWSVGSELPKYGVTSFLPTIITAPPESIKAAQKKILTGPPGDYRGAGVLGLHIEGPFLNPVKKGAHNPEHLRLPDPDLYKDFSPDFGIRLVTLAPEISGASLIIDMLSRNGVVVSAGHSAATYQEGLKAIEDGIRYLTHSFNAMSPYHQHDPGLLGAALDDDRIMLGLIADGIHVHPSVIRMLMRTAGTERLNLVTDAVGALGRPPGEYLLGDQPITVTESGVRLSDGTLAGSNLSADMAVRNLMNFTGCNLSEAAQTISTNPARLLHLDSKIGQISTGSDADLVLVTEQVEIALTMVKGKIVFTNPSLISLKPGLS